MSLRDPSAQFPVNWQKLQFPCVRYFRKPLRGPRPTESENPPATKKENPKNPKTPIIPKSKRSFPKSRCSFPKSRRSFPKSRRSLFFREFLKNLKFLKFPAGGSRSQGFRKYLTRAPSILILFLQSERSTPSLRMPTTCRAKGLAVKGQGKSH